MVINCKGKILDLNQPKVMAIVNLTPDSFYDGNKYNQNDELKHRIDDLIKSDVDIIDLGAMSSKPGSKEVPVTEELDRLGPALEYLQTLNHNSIISIDTYRSEVIKYAVANGAHMLNDISAGSIDESLLKTTATLKIPYVLMHMQGTPSTMQQSPEYNDVSYEVLTYFVDKLRQLRSLGIKDVILDPGFGFGKTVEHNFQLLKKMSVFKILDCPILAGVSRKSMIYKTLNTTADQALNGTTSLHMLALMNGAKILRVHDVNEAKECIKLYSKYTEV